jgi:hypothetical protein
MRRICENLGMAWQSQNAKLMEQREKFNRNDIVTVAEDGKAREMVAVPVRKLALWLASINPATFPPSVILAPRNVAAAARRAGSNNRSLHDREPLPVWNHALDIVRDVGYVPCPDSWLQLAFHLEFECHVLVSFQFQKFRG